MAKTLDGLQGNEGSNLDSNNCILDVWWPYVSCMFRKHELYIYIYIYAQNHYMLYGWWMEMHEQPLNRWLGGVGHEIITT